LVELCEAITDDAEIDLTTEGASDWVAFVSRRKDDAGRR
jgi:hypothetical protein